MCEKIQTLDKQKEQNGNSVFFSNKNHLPPLEKGLCLWYNKIDIKKT